LACVQSQTPKEVGTAQLRTKACYARSARFPDFWENNFCKKINTLNMLRSNNKLNKYGGK
jgi:hypothetical protein